MRLMFHTVTISWEAAQCLVRAEIPLTSANAYLTKFAANTTPSRPDDVAPVAYVGTSDQLQIEERGCTTENAVSAVELLELNRDLQGSRAIRLLATTNLSLYATLMERHLSDGALPETDHVVRLERDLDDLDDAQSGVALIKSWAAQGWLHRIVDERHDHNVCYLTQDARRALDFLPGMRRCHTIATGGSITGIASRLKQVAVKVDNDPARIRKHIEAEITALPENSTNSTPESALNPTSPTATTRPAPSPCRWNA
jgi:Protein of unknown function (DUF3375)